ncbi:DUF721 domain-containing protein [Streptomyces sp. NPDC020096]
MRSAIEELLRDAGVFAPIDHPVVRQWPEIAGPLAPYLAAIHFDTSTSELTLQAASPAWGTQARLLAKSIISRVNEHLGTQPTVRTIRVLAVAPGVDADSGVSAPATRPSPGSSARLTGEQRAAGHAAFRRTAAGDLVDPAVQAARDRQARQMSREPQQMLPDGRTAAAGQRERAEERHAASEWRDRAVLRARAQRTQ